MRLHRIEDRLMNMYTGYLRHAIRGVALVLLITICAGLVGCDKKIVLTTGLKSDEVFRISGESCWLGEAMLMLAYEKSKYEKEYGEEVWTKQFGDTTLSEKIKEQTKKNLADIKSMRLYAKTKKISLSDDEKNKIKEASAKYYSTLTEQQRLAMNVSEKDINSLYSDFYLADKLFKSVTANITLEISDASAKVIKVQSIYFKTYDIDENHNKVHYDETKKLEVKTKAESILADINAGNDFQTVAEKNSDDPNVEYEFGRGQMVIEYEEAAFSLEKGKVSGLIVTTDGFYIVKCISDYEEDKTLAHKEEMLEAYKQTEFMKSYEPYVSTLSSQFNDELWKSVDFTSNKDISAGGLYDIYILIK